MPNYYGYRVTYKDRKGVERGKTIFVTTQSKLVARTKAVKEHLIDRSSIISVRFCSC